MKTLTLCLLVCASMGLIRAAALPQEEDPYTTQETTTSYLHSSCPDGWTKSNTQCLRYVPTNTTWKEAEANCRSMGGNLAFQIMEEQTEDARKVVLDAGVEHGLIWVGGGRESYLMFWGFNSDQAQCSYITADENAPEDLENVSCDDQLPSVCGIVIM